MITIELVERALLVALGTSVEVQRMEDDVAETPDGWWRVSTCDALQPLDPLRTAIVEVGPEVRSFPPVLPRGVALTDEGDWVLDPDGVQRAWRAAGTSGIEWGALLALRFDRGLVPQQVVRQPDDVMTGGHVRADDPVPPEATGPTCRLLTWRGHPSGDGRRALTTWLAEASDDGLVLTAESTRLVLV